jgi:Fe-S-cluster containining protein
MGITDLVPPKPPGPPCVHVCSRGCRIYTARPPSCREFVCVWAQGGIPKEHRPDKVGVCFTSDGERLIGFVDPQRPTAWRRMATWLEGVGRRGAVVLIGLPGDKPHTMFSAEGEQQRPPEADT